MKDVVEMTVDELVKTFGVEGVADLLAFGELIDEQDVEFARRYLPPVTRADLERDRHPRPTGQDLFDAKTKDEQDEMLGPEAAEMVRTGEIELADLVHHTTVDGGPGFITQRSLKDLPETRQ